MSTPQDNDKSKKGREIGLYVALLRGINVGGKNKLPMRQLGSLCTSLGASDVRTYLQSGNVVFCASSILAKGLEGKIAKAITESCGLHVPVLIRAAEELIEVARRNPFLGTGADMSALHVAFLSGVPTRFAVAGLDPQRSPPDEFRVLGREVYLHLPNGVARSRLTNEYLDSRLDTVSTIRSWKTVQALVAMVSEG